MDFNQLIDKAFLLKFVKFCIVGFSGVFVDFGTTYFFKEIVKIQKYVANAIGFTTAATTNYILNRVWTFQSHNPHVVGEFSRFFIIALIGLGINSLIIFIFSGKFKWNFYLSKLIATLVVTLWNFLINAYFTFA
ncbi:MAG TPA: GtrA family protein [Bacteroidales bacterium]|nr:GtrA family protein [Bacteroidales bacterium]